MLAASFPHATERVELIETHISWVILTGDWAYKLKKPVRFDFLDYSTVALREKFCWRELETNRVWAQDIYVDVVPVFEHGDGELRVGVAGQKPGDDETVIDHAVRMRQFPQSALLAEQLGHGAVTAGDMETLAGELADLHSRIASVPYRDDLVSGGSTRPAIENCDYLVDHLTADDPDRGRAERMKAWTLEAIDRLEPTLETRAKAGAVRKCHGDLHLGNVLFLDGRFVPFDGIEFNDSFSQVEGLDEVAFLAMELSEHGYVGHCRRLLNRYVEATGDYGGLPLLRYFLAYRAMVRAKVDLIRQTQTHGGDKAALSDDGRRYLDYAMRVTAPKPAELWITYGLSGSGKSTASTRVIEDRGVFRLRSDVLRKRIAGRDPLEKTPPDQLASLYSSQMTTRTYDRMLDLADQILAAGWGVIVDATFLKAAQRVRFADLAASHQAAFHILVCVADRDELLRRIETRGPDPSDASASVLAAQIEHAQPPGGDEQRFVIHASQLGE
jgi:aminoglycoside phosphotransferase family enzyme/predicted kinase